MDFIQTGDLTFSVITKYSDEATCVAAGQKIAEIRGQAATQLPVRTISHVKGNTFVSR